MGEDREGDEGDLIGHGGQLSNPDFNPIEFDGVRRQAGLNSFSLTADSSAVVQFRGICRQKPGRVSEEDMGIRIHLDKDKIAEFCRRRRITEFAIFGSALREDFRPDSDVDVLVTFDPTAKVSLLDLADMEIELKEIVGREVDIAERPAVERSENYIRRKHILSNMEMFYVEG